MSDDLISRQAAIAKLFSKLDQQDLYLPIHFKSFVLDELPSVQPKTGRWIDDNCSECGQYVYHGDARNFCPNCGAKMESEE